MKERPILMNAPMVRAILAGQKTQTRRVMKPQPEYREIEQVGNMLGFKRRKADGFWLWPNARERILAECPYGLPGDRLWVRETFYCDNAFYPDGVGVDCMWRTVDGKRVPIPVEEQRKQMFDEDMYYRADGEPDFEGAEGPTPWRPSIHMPRWASRITLEIVGVRVERLQAISEADAWAEGCKRGTQDDVGGYFPAEEPLPRGAGFRGWDNAREWFAGLWEEINGEDSWDANPWVWVVEFKRAEA